MPGQVGVDRIFKGAQMKNSDAMEKVLKSAVDAAVGQLLLCKFLLQGLVIVTTIHDHCLTAMPSCSSLL